MRGIVMSWGAGNGATYQDYVASLRCGVSGARRSAEGYGFGQSGAAGGYGNELQGEWPQNLGDFSRAVRYEGFDGEVDSVGDLRTAIK
jgi:hypothetical protein